MDDATRGFIESMIDDALKENILSDVEWIRREIPISSLRDLALGYFLGISSAYSSTVTIFKHEDTENKQVRQVIRALLKRRFPEIIEKINRELNV